ncbi:MAG: ComF family protein [Clostridia bacterium]|nr:ComF family protein [Clostridia bacterium]
MGKSLFSFLWRWLIPNRCVFCSRMIPEKETLCPACSKQEKSYLLTACPKCGRSFSLCTCHASPQGPDLILYPFSYRKAPISAALKRFKKFGYGTYARFFSLHMARLTRYYPQCEEAEVICAIPVHASAFREKDFNHAEILAVHLACLLKKEYRPLLIKTRKTAPQKALTAAQRRKNLHNCFSVNGPVPSVVLLVDDITTTGSTLNEAVRTLKKNGAEKVYCITAASAI